jgi:hypothetical protein
MRYYIFCISNKQTYLPICIIKKPILPTYLHIKTNRRTYLSAYLKKQIGIIQKPILPTYLHIKTNRRTYLSVC